jgi:hypothetical protein
VCKDSNGSVRGWPRQSRFAVPGRLLSRAFLDCMAPEQGQHSRSGETARHKRAYQIARKVGGQRSALEWQKCQLTNKSRGY